MIFCTEFVTDLFVTTQDGFQIYRNASVSATEIVYQYEFIDMVAVFLA